jgi:tetratricopeptide (TPR) repeat protein/tRNA A-37 threonylcarbamoyl transferase component Bud32
MQNVEWLKIKEIFHRTLNLPKIEREKFLANQDDFVCAEVRRLLDSHEKLEEFIAEPIALEIGLDTNSYIGKTIGNYKIVSLLGAGGMGQVFLAEKEGLDKKFALKIIKRGMDTDSILKRFVRERQILSRLENPYIASLLDAGSTENDLPFFVMEYVDGLPITKFCDEHQFDTKERLEIFQKVCEAVKYAHRNLIVHRDLKPSNILVTADGTPKLLDFGIAKLLDSESFENTATKSQMFTPEYASPEQISGSTITTATDVYSLGVVLYELLSGVRPFNSTNKSYREIANFVLTEEPLRPSSVVHRRSQFAEKITDENKGQRTKHERQKTIRNPQSAIRNLKGDLDNIILKSLRKEPERRYQSVQEFSEDIRRYLVGLPVTVTADSTVYRFKKFVNRHRLGTIFATLILAVSGFAFWQSFVANRERVKAERRVAQVREVAKSLLNETSQNLQNLPDGSEVRQQIIEKSAKILDSLSAEVDDVEYLSELGTAYTQLGQSRTWNLRDYEHALNDLQKARNLHERVVELEPNNVKYLGNLVATLGVLSEFHGIQGNTDKVVENFETIVKINRKQLEIEPNNPNVFFNSSGSYDILSEYYNGVGRKEESVEASKNALELLERAIELQQAKEQTPDVQTQLAGYFMQKGYILKKSGKEEEAIFSYQKAAETADQAYFRDNTQKFGFNHSTRSRRMMAEIYVNRGDWQKVLELYQHCLNSLLQNKENKHLDRKGLPGAIALYTMFVGNAQDKLGKKPEGRENVEKGLNLYLANLKKYENLAADILYTPQFLLPAMNYYVENDEKSKAADLWQREYINRLETILQKTPDDVGVLHRLADGFQQKGDVLSGFQNESISETNPAVLQEAKENYEKSMEQVQKILLLDKSAFHITQKAEVLERKIGLLKDKLIN